MLLKVTCVALVVKRVRMPSGSPSGNVWICTVLLELAVTSLLFWKGKNKPQPNTNSCCVDSLQKVSTEMNQTLRVRKQPKLAWRLQVTNLECQRVNLLPNCDELWIIIVQTLKYPNVTVGPTGHNEPEEKEKEVLLHIITLWWFL